jgi:dTMP kinase
MMDSGFFITFEGPEGAGKSTQVKLLADRLQHLGYDVLLTREPGGTYIGEEIRRLVKDVKGEDGACDEAELLLFSASRAQLVRRVIVPHLQHGGVVICDRFADSTTAYQGYARGWALETITRMHEVALGDCWPDLTLVLDLSLEEGIARREERESETATEADRLELESDSFHERVRQGFLTIASLEGNRVKVIDAAQGIDVVQDAIWQEVGDRFLV